MGSLYIGSFCIGSLEVWENIFLLRNVILFTCFTNLDSVLNLSEVFCSKTFGVSWSRNLRPI